MKGSLDKDPVMKKGTTFSQLGTHRNTTASPMPWAPVNAIQGLFQEHISRRTFNIESD